MAPLSPCKGRLISYRDDDDDDDDDASTAAAGYTYSNYSATKQRTWSVIGAVVGSCRTVSNMSVTCCRSRVHDDCSPLSLVPVPDVNVLPDDNPSLHINTIC